MRHILLAMCVIAFPLCSVAEAQSARQFAQEACRERTPVVAGLIHGMWERGQLDGDPFRQMVGKPSHIGSGLMALSITIRLDPHLSHMSEAEFVELAIRICEPVYEVYFQKRLKTQ